MHEGKEKSLLVLSAPPHIKTGDSINKIMWTVAAVLMLPAIYSVYIFGYHAALILFACVVSAVSAEAAFQYFMKKEIKEIKVKNGSSVITGLLIAMNVPPDSPIWMSAIGSIFAIIIVKEFFGGLGYNIFNPALAGRAFMMASWPAHMTTSNWHNFPPVEGAVFILLIFIAGLFLIFRRIITWHIPFSFIVTIAIVSYLYYYFLGITQPEVPALLNIFSGGIFLGAFFMATDLVTSPVSMNGMIIFGIGCGLLTFTIMILGGYPEGWAYSILIMNAVVPLIDRFTKNRFTKNVFGA